MSKFNFSKKSYILLIILFAILIFFLTPRLMTECINCKKKQKNTPLVSLFYHAPATHEFWKEYTALMKITADNLGMNLETYGSNWNFTKMASIVNKLIYRKNGPNVAAISPISPDKGAYLIELINSKKIPCLVVNERYTKENYKKYRLKNSEYLIGQIYADNFDAGYRITKELAKKARPAEDGKIYMLALTGYSATETSIERVNGLKKAVSEDQRIKLVKIIPANWDSKLAKERFIYYKKVASPNISAIWATSDNLAIGALEGAEELGLTPGKDIVAASINWTKPAIGKIKEGKLLGSMGGHYFEGAWAAVILYDYINGVRFPIDKREWTHKMYFIDKNNLNKYEKLLDEKNWSKLDFKVFTKTNNPNFKEYNFDINKLLEQLEQRE